MLEETKSLAAALLGIIILIIKLETAIIENDTAKRTARRKRRR